MNEDRLRQLLREAPVPAEGDAEERGLRVVRAAFAQREPTPAARPLRPRLALALAAALLLLALLLSPAGAKVRDLIDDAVTTSKPTSGVLTDLPGGGQLLVESAQGAWIVHADGSQRLLGSYDDSAWSPHGLYVAATSGNQLSAIDPLGNVRWSLSNPAPISDPRWSRSGFRVAYRAGDSLRVVEGDGTGDHELVSKVAPVAPAWRPGDANVIAYGDPGGGVHVVNADTGRRLLASVPHGPKLLQLDWSGDGQRLLALYPHVALVIDPPRRIGLPLIHFAGPRDGRFVAADFAPTGHRLAVIVHHAHASPPHSELVLTNVDSAVSGRPKPHRLFSGPGSFSGLAWSPSGRRILVAWRDADQWLFIPPGGRAPVESVGDIARQFDPGTTSPAAYPGISGWCCPP